MSGGGPGFRIREYRPGDAPQIARLYFDSVRGLGPRRYTAEQVTAWAPSLADPAAVHARASDGRTTLVAVDEADAVLAYGDLQPDGHIDHVYGRPDVAGTGVAAALLDALLARARQAGMSRLFVEASELARGLFERRGFTLTHRRDFELRGVAIHNYALERQL
jgi:putative acetyltransferase